MMAGLVALLAQREFTRAQTAARLEEAAPGQAVTAGKDVGSQGEKDWVDGRWNQTDVGPFLASSLQTPGGWIAKGLSIRVGENGEAAVCYDTGNPSLRGAWTGGFLKFVDARFGLIGAPKPAGEWAFSTSTNVGWQGVNARHEALHMNGKRVILDTRVGDTLVRESPWFEKVSDLNVFTRTFEIGAGKLALTNLIFAQTHGVVRFRSHANVEMAMIEHDEHVTAVACKTQAGTKLATVNNQISVTVEPRSESRLVRLFLWSGPVTSTTEFEKLVASSSAPENLTKLSQPGPAHWLPALTTTGQIGFATDGFAVDTLTVPYANPWKALMFCSGVDFFRDGSAAVSTIHGDVWHVTGIDDKLRAVTWKRFATGLYQPLGLRVVNDKVHVLGRDQITILHDDNGDDEADRYENFSNLIDTSTSSHDFVTCLERDEAGNFYYVDPRGVHRLAADGKSKETLGTGFRNPNGLGVGPSGVVTVTPQQGNWTPSSAIVEVKLGGYYGYGGPKVTTDRPLGFDAPLCWLPHAFDNSSSSQVWVPKGSWGALGGQMLSLAWGRCSMMLVLRDVIESQPQGAAVGLPAKFLSGPMRGTFSPKDGQLYVAGSTGWQTSALKDGSFQRVRYTGAPPRWPVAWHAHRNGLAITFSQPLDRATAEDPGSFAVHQWNYRYAASYGSKDYSIANPDKEGRDEVEVRAAKLSADGRTVFIETPELKPVMQMEVKSNLRFTSGASAGGPLYLTLNKLDGAFAP